MGPKRLPAGHESGIVARAGEGQFGFKLMPPQTRIDTQPLNLTKGGWRKRFRLIMTGAKGAPINVIFGDVRNILSFGRFVKSRYGHPPKSIWNISVIVCSGTIGIHAKYKLSLRSLFGDCTVLENYSTAEGSLAQQMDQEPFLVPNYDLYFYEIQTKDDTKPLYSMRPEETGSLVVSTPVLPRYRIGDVIKCISPNKFVVMGREKSLGKLKYNMFTSGSPMASDRDIW
jgi:hypothetical protein